MPLFIVEISYMVIVKFYYMAILYCSCWDGFFKFKQKSSGNSNLDKSLFQESFELQLFLIFNKCSYIPNFPLHWQLSYAEQNSKQNKAMTTCNYKCTANLFNYYYYYYYYYYYFKKVLMYIHRPILKSDWQTSNVLTFVSIEFFL